MDRKKNIKIADIEPNKGQIEGLPQNPRFIKDNRFKQLVKSIEDAPEMLDPRPLIVYPHEKKYVIIAGNMRFRACKELGYKELPCYVLPEETPAEKLREYAIKDNVGFGQDDWDILMNEWDTEELKDWGMEMPEAWSGNNEEETETEEHKKLTEKFIIPPFTIWDSRQGYWNERKAIWKKKIGDNGESREMSLSEAELMNGINNGVSILDPVMAEIICRWFGIENGKAFDCFAGDTIFGFVSSYCGMEFTGIELRKEQCDLNNERTKDFKAKYICDDGRNVCKHLEKESQDLFFSCPPYFDLEVYSDNKNDASNQETYSDFLEILQNAFVNSIKCLKQDRFAVVVIGDVRDKNGYYLGIPDDIKRIFKDAGMKLYNEAILIEPLGTLPQRVGRYMENRKLGKCHQNILIFYKGELSKIKTNYKKISYESGDLEQKQVD